MKIEKFSCPSCGTRVPNTKALYMTNFTKISCQQCGARIRPTRKALSIIGGVGGGIGGALGAVIIRYGFISDNWTAAVFMLLLSLIFLVSVSLYFTIKFTDFVEA